MKILVSGPGGLIGRSLIPTLQTEGHTVVGLSRRAGAPGDFVWAPEKGELNGDLDGIDAVIHLAGESVAGGRWTRARKKRIRDSRVMGTDLLARRAADARAKSKAGSGPRIFISASAIGFYGDGGDATLTESGRAGSGFLVDVAREWEGAAEPARQAGIRVVQTRIGIVLSPAGGALQAMLPIFRLGLGGRLGSGRQWMSWIALPDVIGAIRHVLAREDIQGPVNFTAPTPVTNADFTRALGRSLGRPAFLPAPAFAMKLALGSQMAQEMLLTGARVSPQVLEKTGYHFQFPELSGALESLLEKSS